MRKILLTLLAGLWMFSAGCVTTGSQPAQTSGLLGVVGAGAGAALDDGNRWRGALIGGLAGMATGYGLGAINQQYQQPYYPSPPPPQAPAPGGYYAPGYYQQGYSNPYPANHYPSNPYPYSPGYAPYRSY